MDWCDSRVPDSRTLGESVRHHRSPNPDALLVVQRRGSPVHTLGGHILADRWGKMGGHSRSHIIDSKHKKASCRSRPRNMGSHIGRSLNSYYRGTHYSLHNRKDYKVSHSAFHPSVGRLL